MNVAAFVALTHASSYDNGGMVHYDYFTVQHHSCDGQYG